MIFVIAAVLTIIISFVVALTSLIREQNKQMGSSAKRQEPRVGNVPVSGAVQSSISPGLNTQSQSAQVMREPVVKPDGELPSLQVVDKDTNLSREPFFWEKTGEQVKGENVDSEESIEKLQQRLVEYTRSKQQKDIAKDDKTFPKKEIVKKNLSGEFSLSDLK